MGTWKINGKDAPNARKIPYVPPYKTFLKLDDAEKEKLFNMMRGELAGKMESRGS